MGEPASLPYAGRVEIRTEVQLGDVADEVSAITAVVRPILTTTVTSWRSSISDGRWCSSFSRPMQSCQRRSTCPRPAQRQVARYLATRRKFAVLDVIEALAPLSQPELLETREMAASVVLSGGTSDVIETLSVLAPQPQRM